jgi:hypothetical protein
MTILKTTLEIPDSVFRRAKSAAVERGVSFRQFVTQAIKEKLSDDPKSADKPWMVGFGKLRRFRKETARINRLIEEEFERIEAQDRM